MMHSCCFPVAEAVLVNYMYIKARIGDVVYIKGRHMCTIVV
jgi:hypothetical protein